MLVSAGRAPFYNKSLPCNSFLSVSNGPMRERSMTSYVLLAFNTLFLSIVDAAAVSFLL